MRGGWRVEIRDNGGGGGLRRGEGCVRLEMWKLPLNYINQPLNTVYPGQI
jgi:hypothetical protein